MKACIDNFELSFFCDAKNFNDAKKICEEHKSYLVKIDNANMTEIIKDVIDEINCPYREDYHAGATADNNRKWTWLDGSRVYLRDEGGYQNWRDGQPNDVDGREDCMKLDKYTTKWFDSPCNGPPYNGQPGEGRYYICQKNLTLNIKITKLSYNELKCSATSGTCVNQNQVEWRRNNVTVSIFQNHSVYQELSSGTSFFHYENATINDGGEYFCVIWVRNNEANRVSALAHIKVNGTAEVNNIDSFTCNSSLVIFWSPHPRSIGFIHRIEVIDSYSGYLVREIMNTPVRNTRHITEIVGLQPETIYLLQISACKDKTICTDEYTVNATATTGGIVIKNATMLSENDTCIVTWNWPYNISVVFWVKIIVNFTLGNSISEVNEVIGYKIMNNTDIELSHSFEMQPEQACKVQIRIISGENVCRETVNVIGSCQRRNLPTTTSDQVTSENKEANTTNIIVPVVSAIAVIVLLTVAFVAYRMKTGTKQSGQPNTKTSHTTNAAADYATVGDGEIIAAYSTINDQPAVYVNYQQNSPYETVETNQNDITDIYETPISGK